MTCSNCNRADCPLFKGGRSEAAYIDCLQFTSERVRHAMRQLGEAARDGSAKEQAFAFEWLENHKDEVVRLASIKTAQAEVAAGVWEARARAAEKERDRATEEASALQTDLFEARKHLIREGMQRDAAAKVLVALQAWWDEPDARIWESGHLKALRWTARASEVERLYLIATISTKTDLTVLLQALPDGERTGVLDHFCKSCGEYLEDGGGWCANHEPDPYAHHGEDA